MKRRLRKPIETALKISSVLAIVFIGSIEELTLKGAMVTAGALLGLCVNSKLLSNYGGNHGNKNA